VPSGLYLFQSSSIPQASVIAQKASEASKKTLNLPFSILQWGACFTLFFWSCGCPWGACFTLFFGVVDARTSPVSLEFWVISVPFGTPIFRAVHLSGVCVSGYLCWRVQFWSPSTSDPCWYHSNAVRQFAGDPLQSPLWLVIFGHSAGCWFRVNLRGTPGLLRFLQFKCRFWPLGGGRLMTLRRDW